MAWVTERFDIVVAGAGPIGLAFAASLAGAGLRLALADPQPESALAEPGDDGREIRAHRPQRRFAHPSGRLVAHPGRRHRPACAGCACSTDPPVTRCNSARAARAAGCSAAFAPNHQLRRSLYSVVRALPDVSILAGVSIASLRIQRDGVLATLSDGRTVSASLAIAADTRRSRLRQQQGIGANLHDYRQRMLVCPMAHPVAHQEIATAWFEYGQTLVTLPLNGGRSSAVMTVSDADAGRLLRLDDEAFGRELTRRYRGRLGPMQPVGARHAVPVVTTYANRFVGRRFALLGDAAVGMHPTTAHGFNFGILGQDALATELRSALAAGRDIADPTALSRYEAAHRAETRLFFAGAEALIAPLCGRRQRSGAAGAQCRVATGKPAAAAPRAGGPYARPRGRGRLTLEQGVHPMQRRSLWSATGGLLAGLLGAGAARAETAAQHKIVFHAGSADPAMMAVALGNIVKRRVVLHRAS